MGTGSGWSHAPGKPEHLHGLADVRRVMLQLLLDSDERLRAVGQSLQVLLERAEADVQRVLQHARQGMLVGVPANLGAWPEDEAAAYVEQHVELLARLNPDDIHLAALLRRRPELFARAAVWLEVARWHYERDHPGSADPGDATRPTTQS